jgi:hypothetical protein
VGAAGVTAIDARFREVSVLGLYSWALVKSPSPLVPDTHAVFTISLRNIRDPSKRRQAEPFRLNNLAELVGVITGPLACTWLFPAITSMSAFAFFRPKGIPQAREFSPARFVLATISHKDLSFFRPAPRW